MEGTLLPQAKEAAKEISRQPANDKARWVGSSQERRKWLITMVIGKSPKEGCGTPSKWP